jgi:hypothetical protein
VVDQALRPDLFPLTWLLEGSAKRLFAWADETPSGLEKWTYLTESLLWRQVSYVRLPYRWPLAQVIESFRRLNTEGTRFDPSELEAAIARALTQHEAAS